MGEPTQAQPPGLRSAMVTKPDCGEESYRGHERLQGKVAVITGGDSGIGRAVAIAYARDGADVLISYLNEDEDAEDTARLVRAVGRQVMLVAGDISDAQSAPGRAAACRLGAHYAAEQHFHRSSLPSRVAIARPVLRGS